jgi:hypothetical protein
MDTVAIDVLSKFVLVDQEIAVVVPVIADLGSAWVAPVPDVVAVAIARGESVPITVYLVRRKPRPINRITIVVKAVAYLLVAWKDRASGIVTVTRALAERIAVVVSLVGVAEIGPGWVLAVIVQSTVEPSVSLSTQSHCSKLR